MKSIRKQILPRLSINVRNWSQHCSQEATRARAVYDIEALLPTTSSIVRATGA
jgi:hypothetical protein